MEQALGTGIAMIGIARPLCATPDAVAELLSGRIDQLPRPEKELRIGPGWLGPNSPFKMVKAMNGFAAQAWYYQQLRRIAAGKPAEPGLNPFSAFLATAGRQGAQLSAGGPTSRSTTSLYRRAPAAIPALMRRTALVVVGLAVRRYSSASPLPCRTRSSHATPFRSPGWTAGARRPAVRCPRRHVDMPVAHLAASSPATPSTPIFSC